MFYVFYSWHYEDIKHADYLMAQCISNFSLSFFWVCQLFKNAPLCFVKTVDQHRLNYVWRPAVSINDVHQQAGQSDLLLPLFEQRFADETHL